MMLTVILAILTGTLIGWLFIQPQTNQMLWRLFGERNKF
jgi:hypothetical protein